jgi:hypothetical protein
LLFGLLAVGFIAATPAHADFAVVEFSSGYCRVWTNTAFGPEDGHFLWFLSPFRTRLSEHITQRAFLVDRQTGLTIANDAVDQLRDQLIDARRKMRSPKRCVPEPQLKAQPICDRLADRAVADTEPRRQADFACGQLFPPFVHASRLPSIGLRRFAD